MSRRNRPVTKDMYWFAHGGAESMGDKNLARNISELEEENESNRKGIYDDQKSPYFKDTSLTDGSNSSGPPSLERDDRLHAVEKRMAVEERRKLIWEAEQERNDAVMRKHLERGAALEARRNAQRSTISFAFGSSVPRNVDTLQLSPSVETDSMSRSFTAASSSHREDIMTKSMSAAISAPRGRRKNDLMPTVPYERTPAPRVAASSSSRRRSVSMTRLDQLALPRKHYVEATKANSTASSGTSSLLKDVSSPNRPLSSASENSGGRVANNVTRRIRSSPRKPRPVSIAGTIPDHKKPTTSKLHEVKIGTVKKTPAKKTETTDVRKAPYSATKSSTPKSADRPKSTPRPATAPVKASTPKNGTPRPAPSKPTAKPKKAEFSTVKDKMNSSTKSSSAHFNAVNKKKTDVQVTSKSDEVKAEKMEKSGSPVPDSDASAEIERNGKRIISEEEAKAALAEKRRVAREQAEREAELERQRQEELRRQEEERLRREEEEQQRFEEESMRLLEEHKRQEEEKLRKAIEDQELKKEEERVRQEEELRLKAEQDRKAKEESEKMRLEMEEKLRKEEEERAERKKRLEKIMSRTRGKSSGTSPSGSVSGSDHLDSSDNQQEGFSSGANSLESNEGANSPSEHVSSDDAIAKMEVSSGGNSIEANLTYEFGSNDASLNSNDLMLPVSETASQENSMTLYSDKDNSLHESVGNESNSAPTLVNPVEDDVKQLENETKTEIIDHLVSGDVEAYNIALHLFDGINEKENDVLNTQYVNNDLIEGELHPEPSESHKAATHQFESESSEVKEESQDLVSNAIAAVSSTEVETLTVDNEKEFEGSSFNQKQEDIKAFVLETEVIDNSNKDEMSTINREDHANSPVFSENSPVVESNQSNDPFTNSILNNDVSPNNDEELALGEEQLEIQDQISSEDPKATGDNLVDTGPTIDIKQNYDISENDGKIVNDVIHQVSEVQSFGDDAFGSPFANHNSPSADHGDGEAVHSEQSPSQFYSHHNGAGDASEAFNFEKQAFETNTPGDNPFASNYESKETEQNMFSSPSCDNISNTPNHLDFYNQKSNPELDNVTLIKEEGSEKFVGIISSIDNDHFSNSFPKLSEQLINNHECASTTESEDSSLDSNLSQVIAPDESSGANHVTSNNGGHLDNPFNLETHQSSIPQASVDHYSEFEVYSNGHSTEESSKQREFLQLDGKGILSVDKSNIFESVEAIDFGKISSDPFLAKGSSHQITGNPFLMQDEQKPLLTSDFLN